MSRIEWTEQTWNPTTGCDRVSPGCANCYAVPMAARLKLMGQPKYQRDGDPRTSGPGFGLTMHPDTLDEPFGWKKPRRVFVNSMSDLFHEDVTDAFIAQIWAVMAATPQHTYQILTKRPERMRVLVGDDFGGGQNLLTHLHSEDQAQAMYDAHWPLPNVWLGVSAENQAQANKRVPLLLETSAAVRFVSVEPMLGAVDLARLARPNGSFLDAFSGDVFVGGGSIYAAAPGSVDWVIVGGESGPGARPFPLGNARSIVVDCEKTRTALFVKQLGAVWARQTSWSGETVWNRGDHKGGNPDYWPADLRVRQYPGGAS